MLQVSGFGRVRCRGEFVDVEWFLCRVRLERSFCDELGRGASD